MEVEVSSWGRTLTGLFSCQFRLIFYMHHVICQSETLQKHGYVAIVNFEVRYVWVLRLASFKILSPKSFA
jgi:hypothetical protein